MINYRLFTYEVSCYNNEDEIDDWQGIIFAESYEDVITKLKECYGDGEITKLTIVEYYNESEDTFMELSKSTIQNLIEKGELRA